MSKAHTAPKRAYSYAVTDHAVLRMRERFPEGKLLPFTTDDDVRIALDQAVVESIREGRYESLIDDGVPGKIVDISDRYDDMFALVKEDPNPRAQFAEGIVTVLTRDHVENNKNHPGWNWEMSSKPGGKMNSALKEKLSPVVLKKPQIAAPAESKVEVISAPDYHMVVWGAKNHLWPSKKEAMEYVEGLLESGLALKDIKVCRAEWVPLKTKLRVELE